MSSGSRLLSNPAARRAILQTYSRLPSHGSSALRLRSTRHSKLPTYTEALAILIPRRTYATETSTHHSDNGPPPGFNINEAKKPLPKEEAKQSAQAQTFKDLRQSDGQLKDSKNTATATDNTATQEDESLTELAAEKAENQAKHEAKNVVVKKEEEKKLTLGQKIRREVAHYWDGTKLLATEVKISMKLALKMAAGYELSRRENRQLKRTVQDLGRLVPFSVFVIVPFGELFLPLALKIFPNLLPSTYEGQKSKEAKAATLRGTRNQISTFLRETLKETGLPINAATAKKEDFTEFFRKVRSSGEQPTKEDVIKICRSFKDDLTLDNLSRPQLVGTCKYLNLNTFGTDTMLRYQIRHRMRQLKRDDKSISYEGVDSLSVPELQMACASRGLRTHGMSPGKLREDLQMWLDLRLKYNIPSTLLVLSNAYMYTSGKDSEIDTQIDALQAVLSSIPEELFHEIELEVHNAEGAATNKQRLEVLKEQQEMIDEENAQTEANKKASAESKAADVKDDKNIDETPKKAKTESETSSSDPAVNEAREAEVDAKEQAKNEETLKEKDVKKD